MIVDSSALIALLCNEPEADRMTRALSREQRKLMSAMNYLETGIVVGARFGEQGTADLEALVTVLDIDIVAFDAGLAEIALDAWYRYGKGRHEAGLNFGDCASYALAELTRLPLLFKGDDFAKTNVLVAQW